MAKKKAAKRVPKTVIRRGFVDLEGKLVIEPRYDDASNFFEGLARVRERPGRPWGYIDPSGAWAIEPRFFKAGDFNQGFAAVEATAGVTIHIDRTGREIVPLPKSNVPDERFVNGRTILVGDEGEGVVDRDGKVIVEPKYYSITNYNEGMALAITRDGRIVGLDDDGHEVFEFDAPSGEKEIHPYNDGLARVRFMVDWKDGDRTVRGLGYNWLDRAGKLLFSGPTGEAEDFQQGFAKVKYGFRIGLVDTAGRILLDRADLRSIGDREEDGTRWATTKDFTQGLLDEKGEWAVEPRFKDVSEFKNGRAVASLYRAGTTWRGLINRRGEWLIEPKYQGIALGDDGYCVATDTIDRSNRNLRWQVLDETGKVVADLGRLPVPPAAPRGGRILISRRVNLTSEDLAEMEATEKAAAAAEREKKKREREKFEKDMEEYRARKAAEEQRGLVSPPVASTSSAPSEAIRLSETVSLLPVARPLPPNISARLVVDEQLPAPLVALRRSDDLVYRGPADSYFVLRQKPEPGLFHFRSGELHDLKTAAHGWPFPHDFTADGRFLFIETREYLRDHVRRIDLTTRESEIVLSGGGRAKSITVAGELVILVTSRNQVVTQAIDGKNEGSWNWLPGHATVARRVLDGRVLIIGSMTGSMFIAVSGGRFESLGFLGPAVNRSDFAIVDVWEAEGRVYCVIDRNAPDYERSLRSAIDTYHRREQVFEIVGLADAWEAALGSGPKTDVTAATGAIERARDAGQIAMRRVGGPPRRSASPVVTARGFSVTEAGYGPYLHALYFRPPTGAEPGGMEGGKYWTSFVADARGSAPIVGAVPKWGQATPEYYSPTKSFGQRPAILTAHHPDGERFLLARDEEMSPSGYGQKLNEVAEVDVAARRWRAVVAADSVIRGIAYFGDGIAVLVKGALRGYSADGDGTFVERWTMTCNTNLGEGDGVTGAFGARILWLRCGGAECFLLGWHAGAIRLLGALIGATFADAWEADGRLFGERDPLRSPGSFVELVNLQEAYAKAFAVGTASERPERLDGTVTATPIVVVD